jgi:hypothetical protein
MTEPTATLLSDWLSVEGDLDDFIFYAEDAPDSEK